MTALEIVSPIAVETSGPVVIETLRRGLLRRWFWMNTPRPADLFVVRECLWLTECQGLCGILRRHGIVVDVTGLSPVRRSLAACPPVVPDEQGRLKRWIRPWIGMGNPISAIAVQPSIISRRQFDRLPLHRHPVYEYDPRAPLWSLEGATL